MVPRHAHTYQPSDPIQSNKSGISIIRVSVLCPDRRHTKYICIYINLRRSRDGAFVRSCVWSTGVCLLPLLHSVRFGHQLRCAHKRIANIIRKVYMERKNMQLELIDSVKNIAFIHVYFFEPMKSTRLACLRLDSRYNISMFRSDHFIGDTSPLFCAAQSSRGNSLPDVYVRFKAPIRL